MRRVIKCLPVLSCALFLSLHSLAQAPEILTVVVAGTGTVTLSNPTGTVRACSIECSASGSVTLTAWPEQGSTFVEWSNVGCAGPRTDLTCAVTAVSVLGPAFAVFAGGSGRPRLVNMATRGLVQGGDNVLIGGFVIQGGQKTVVVRATGPSLAQHGIANYLANPTLQVVAMADRNTIASNDDWQTDSNSGALQESGFAPAHPLESALLFNLQPGAYTAIVSGGTGIALVEVYEVR